MKLLKAPEIKHNLFEVKIELSCDRKDVENLIKTFNLAPDIEYEISIKKSGIRSLSANNYHWLLCEKIAKVLNISKYMAHNQLLIDYGVDWRDQDGKASYVLMKDDDKYIKAQTVHCRPTDATEDRKGVRYRWFVLLKPSHLMTTEEMSKLIDGTIYECESLEIETKPDEEVERMKKSWKAL